MTLIEYESDELFKHLLFCYSNLPLLSLRSTSLASSALLVDTVYDARVS